MAGSYIPIAEQVETQAEARVLLVLAAVDPPLWKDLARLADLCERGQLAPEAWAAATSAAIEPAFELVCGRDESEAETRALAAAARRAKC